MIVGDMAGLVEEWLATCRPELAKSTCRTYRSHLRTFVKASGAADIADVTPELVAEWVHERHLRQSSRRSRWSAVRGFFKWAAAQGRVADDLSLLVPPPRVPQHVPKPLSPDEASAVLRAARLVDRQPQSGPGCTNELMVSLMVQEGLRCIEVRRLEVGDVDLRRGTVYVTGKGGKDRVLPLTGQTRAVLVRHWEECPPAPGPLVTKRGGFDAMTASAINHRMLRIFEVSGIKRGPHDGRSAHSLRATAATDVYRGCLDVRVVQAMLGHDHLSSTQHYIELATAEHLRDAMSGRRY